ncbi:MAG TPA: hypothetical protein VJS47_07615 [Rhizomicrobium sp.]|nr:hypothetical protein [Rhizomicrobium sp.]
MNAYVSNRVRMVDRMAAEFCCGCFIFRAVKTGLKTLPIIADIFALIILSVSIVMGNDFLCLFAIALIVLLAAQERGPIAKALSAPTAVFLGEISYSVYMVHWIMLQVANRIAEKMALTGFGFAAWNVGIIALIMGTSMITYRFIEIPARRFGRKIGVRNAIAAANTDAI